MSEPAGGSKAPPVNFADTSDKSEGNELKLRLHEEQLFVGKEAVETGRLHVTKTTHSREVAVDQDLVREDATIETIPRGHRVFVMPATRVEGDTTIIPIVEEVLYTEKRLILKEEVRITRRKTTEHFHDTVTLRHQEAHVSRIQSATEQPSVGSGETSKRTQE